MKKSVKKQSRKTSKATKQPHTIGTLVDNLKKVAEYMEAGRKGIAANYYCRDLHKLEAGLAELNHIISRLELVKELTDG